MFRPILPAAYLQRMIFPVLVIQRKAELGGHRRSFP
jgi:hypothetical protein